MDFTDYLYVVAVFLSITFLYMFCHSRRMDIERRISLGRIQVTRILADNGRRLSQIGLQIERQFSDTGGSGRLDPREIASEVRRRSTLENISDSDRKQRDRQTKQGDSEQRTSWKPSTTGNCVNELGTGPRHKSTMADESDDTRLSMSAPPVIAVDLDEVHHMKTTQYTDKVSDKNDGDGKGESNNEQLQCQSTHSQHHDNMTEPIRESPALERVSYIQNGPYHLTSRTRRDSIMPVFNTPRSLPRRKSVLPMLAEEPIITRRPSVSQVVLVKPPVYVCPRRSSVLFNSTLFAHTPGRRLSKHSRDDSNDTDDIPSNASTSASESLVPNQTHRRESIVEHNKPSSNATVWQKNIGNRARRRSSSGAVYNPRRGSIAANSRDSAITEEGETAASPLSFFRRRPSQGRRQSIPKLKGNYLTGNLTEFKAVFGPNAHEELTAKSQRFGPLYQINALGQKIVFLFDHKDIESLKKAEGKCPKHMDFKHLRIYRQRNNLPLGVLLSCGEDWKRQRKILSKAMNSTVVQLEYIPVINQVAKEVSEVIMNKLNNEPFSEIYTPEVDVNNYAIEAFGRVLYGRDLNCLSSQKDTDLHKFVEIAKSNFEDAKALMTLPSCLMLLHPAWRRHNEKWNFLLETTIKQALQSIHSNKKNPCVLSHLINNGEMTESEMLVNLTDLLLASIDTTSTAIHWCLYELAKHPKSVKHIADDYRHFVGEGVAVTRDHLQNMTYLKAVVKETLRLHPVGFLACRTISRQMAVREYKVQPQANVAACMYVMGRNKKLVPDSDVFKPRRWLKENQELDRFYKDVPFGFGSRMCIGKRIAELEIALFLLHFCVNFEFRLSPTCQIEHTVKLLLVPSRPLELYIKARKD